MRDRAHVPGMGWWPPKLRLTRSDLCSECASIDFMAALNPPQDFDPQKQPWTLIVERERLIVDSKCPFCRYFDRIHKYTVIEEGNFFIVFHYHMRPDYIDRMFKSEHGKELLPLDKILLTVVCTNNVDNVFALLRQNDEHDNNPFDGILSQKSDSIICHLNKPVRDPRTPQIVPKVFDLSLAKSWLDFCYRHHRLCKCAISTRWHMPRTRLIDCKTRKLINVGVWPLHRPRFAALSYRWGTTSEHTINQDRKSRNARKNTLSDLPLTIEDAISVTKGLGLRYLWVDQYCIDQNNSEEKQAQIQQMDRIYQCAEITILAAAGNDCHCGLPGVSKRARKVPEPLIFEDTLTFGVCPEGGEHWAYGDWHTRGWTFQEAHLSRRRLVFSDTLAHFECSPYEPNERENSGGWETVLHNSKRKRELKRSYEQPFVIVRHLDGYDWASIKPITTMVSVFEVNTKGRHGEFEDCIAEYYSFIRFYTMRRLSHASDGLNAFLGLANAMRDLRHPVYNVAGVPFVLGKKRDDWDYWAESSFSSGLAWLSVEGMDSTDQQDAVDSAFPSWSWSNVKLWPIQHTNTWSPSTQQRDRCKRNGRLRDIQIEFTSEGENQVIGLAEYANKSRKAIAMSLPQPTALLFKGDFMPSQVMGLQPEVDEGPSMLFEGTFWHDTQGKTDDFKISLVLDVRNGTESHEQDPQAHSEAPAGDLRTTRLLVHDRMFHHGITVSGWSLLLLRCIRHPSQMRILVVQGLEGNTARRVGIVDLNVDYWSRQKFGIHDDDEARDMFLACFSVEREVRLV